MFAARDLTVDGAEFREEIIQVYHHPEVWDDIHVDSQQDLASFLFGTSYDHVSKRL